MRSTWLRACLAALLAAGLLALPLAACGADGGETPEEPAQTEQDAPAAPAPSEAEEAAPEDSPAEPEEDEPEEDTQEETKDLAVVSLEEGEVTLRKSGEEQLLVLTCGGEERPVRRLDGGSYSIERFDGVLGMSGVLFQERWHGWSTCSYCIVRDGDLVEIASSFGFIGEEYCQDYSVDLDGDGTNELVCNLMYGGDGAQRTWVYRLQDGVVWRGEVDSSLVPEDVRPAGAIVEYYSEEDGQVVLTYPDGETDEPVVQMLDPLEDLTFSVGCILEETGGLTETIASGDCTDWSGTPTGLTWTMAEDGTLTISGRGALPDQWVYSGPFTSRQVLTLVLEEGVTGLGEGAFGSFRNMTRVELPESLEQIGPEAFRGCEALRSVRLPEGCRVGSAAFARCISLSEAVVPEHAEVAEDAFAGSLWEILEPPA